MRLSKHFVVENDTIQLRVGRSSADIQLEASVAIVSCAAQGVDQPPTQKTGALVETSTPVFLVERETGVEPATCTLARCRSTTEPLPHNHDRDYSTACF